ncbi:MAG: NAD(P)H-binding protein [Synergistaceae bacterium]|nr:NAD(P)H-binding protein [Synergistaceae bacterium]
MTGGTGFIGSAVVSELFGAGHAVTGLAHSEASARRLEKAGAAVIKGSLEETDSLKRGAGSADAAFAHDFSLVRSWGGTIPLRAGQLKKRWAGLRSALHFCRI